MASNQHRNLTGEQLHNPKGFDGASPSTTLIKNAAGEIEWRENTTFDNALDYVSPQSAPPTEVEDDIYLLDDTGVVYDIDTIAWQSGNTIRYTFNGTPNLSAITAGDYLVTSGNGNSSNDGTFVISAVNDGSDYIEITNANRSDATDDEASDAVGTAYYTLEEWDGASKGSHIKFDGTNWNSVNAQDGALCYDETSSSHRIYNATSTNWDLSLTTVGVGAINIVDDTTPQLGGNLDANGFYIDMGTNNITDTKVGQWDTAYGWGDHSTQGYVTSTSEANNRIAVFTGTDAIEGDADFTWNGGLVVTSSSIDAVSVIHNTNSTTNIGVDVTTTTHSGALNSYGHRAIVNASAGGNGYGGFFQTSQTASTKSAFGVYGKVGGGDLGGASYGGFHFVEVNGTSNSGGTIHGSKAQVTVNTSGTHTSTIFGVASDINYDKVGGTLGTAAGFHHSGAVVNTGTITDAYGIYLGDNTGTGTITNSYGVFQAGSDDQNYFAGNVGIGETSPQVKLHASGSGEIARLETSAGTGDNYMTFHDTAQKGLVGYESGSDDLIIENGEIGSSIIFKTAHTGGGGTTYSGLELDGSGDVTVTGILIVDKIQVDGQAYSPPQTLTPTGTTQAINWELGNVVILDLGSATGNVTLTFSNVKAGASYFIQIIQGATFRDVIFPTIAKFAGETAPYTLDVTEANDAIDVVALTCVDESSGSEVLLANVSQNYG